MESQMVRSFATWVGSETTNPLAHRHPIRRCYFATERQLGAMISERSVEGVLIELGPDGMRPVQMLIAVAARMTVLCSVFAEVPLRKIAYDQLTEIVSAGLD